MKILLTGGNGFVGKNIRESFLARKYEITAPQSRELDLTDSQSSDAFFKNKSFDAVLHCAAKPGHRNAKDRSDLFYSNIRMFENLERHKDKYLKFINIGSGAVYGVSDDISNAKEEDIFKNIPADEHGFCKYVIAKQIEKLDNFTDLNVFGIFGKYEDWEIRFISNAVCKAVYGLPITIKQNRKFSYLYIDDLMPILDFFIENKPKFKTYNIVPDEKYELAQLARIIREISAKDLEIKIASDGFAKEYSGSNERLKSEFQSVKFTDIKKSILMLYNYYLQIKENIDAAKLLTDK
ncbi:MAG: NAD-dependent epimerase/dehydratase family protein [Endomicrobium sp.]|jgi:GDP-L-fucose synthase|nr:NAD-dependent epimerase/dehydratase family protein [Endomicrobium sp.]